MAKTRKRSVKINKRTKKLKRRGARKVTGRNFAAAMDVEEPAYRETYEPMDVEEALQDWPTSMDVEPETIVPREFLTETQKIPADYTPPTIHKGLVMHGQSMNERFTLPPNIEVVIFSRRGQLIIDATIERCLKWISKNFGELSTSDMEKYNRKTFVVKTTAVLDRAFQTAYTKLHKDYPQVVAARRFDKSRTYYTATIQTFRGGNYCPNIILSNDENVSGSRISNLMGGWDFSPLRNDIAMKMSLREALPFPQTISLEDFLNDPVFREKHIRLYLFCCRGETKGKEATNSQASNASQPSRLVLNEQGNAFSFPKNSTRRSKNRSAKSQSQ